MNVPWLKLARNVTHAHGEAFAKKLFADALDSGVLAEAVAVTNIVPWPGYHPVDDWIQTPAQQRQDEIIDAIVDLTIKTAKEAIVEAFLLAAREVLARERQRQK
jgi:hypothetical protein